MSEENRPEPWLRGTHGDVHPVPRAALHALELAGEDAQKWCGELSDAEINARPHGVAPVAFHLRHIVRSADRLLTYMEGNALSDAQMAALKTELDGEATASEIFREFEAGLRACAKRIRRLEVSTLVDERNVGRKRLPTTVGGLLVHVADHTQRHVGQAITTAKIVRSMRERGA
jgi:uncharacterized damage-inducible protein DinB